jgi:hypothetical protein
MPNLDVSELLTDPDLCDNFELIRRAEVVNAKGRVSTADTTVPDLLGVFTFEGPQKVMRDPMLTNAPRRIFLATQFAIRSASTGFQPDVVLWNGGRFTVEEVFPYSRYGNGTFEAILQIQEATQVAVDR